MCAWSIKKFNYNKEGMIDVFWVWNKTRVVQMKYLNKYLYYLY